MMTPEAAPLAAVADSPKLSPARLPRAFERLETEEPPHERPREAAPDGTWARIKRVRELYVGPNSWLMGLCLFGPLVIFCPCGACASAARGGGVPGVRAAERLCVLLWAACQGLVCFAP